MKIKTKFFKNFGYFNDEEGQAKFMLIKEVLRMKYKQILAIGKGFDRWVCTSEPDTQISPITASTFQNLQQLYPSLVLPLKFEVYNFGELTTIAAKNRTQTEFTLVTPELFNFN